MPAEAPKGRPPKWQGGDRLLVRLWIVVTLFWTAATLLRVDRVWRLTEDWAAIVRGPWLWLAIVLPPTMFGGVIVAIRYISRAQTALRSAPNRRCPR